MVARANGVGPKLAERIVRELKDKAGGDRARAVAAAPRRRRPARRPTPSRRCSISASGRRRPAPRSMPPKTNWARTPGSTRWFAWRCGRRRSECLSVALHRRSVAASIKGGTDERKVLLLASGFLLVRSRNGFGAAGPDETGRRARPSQRRRAVPKFNRRVLVGRRSSHRGQVPHSASAACRDASACVAGRPGCRATAPGASPPVAASCRRSCPPDPSAGLESMPSGYHDRRLGDRTGRCQRLFLLDALLFSTSTRASGVGPPPRGYQLGALWPRCAARRHCGRGNGLRRDSSARFTDETLRTVQRLRGVGG